MIKHFTFSDERMTISAKRCTESALKNGCDSSVAYLPHNIDLQFYEDNKQILDQERGAGYWLWKSHLMLDALERAKEGDYVIYTDAGILFEQDIIPMINDMDSDVMVFGNRWRHLDWCKMDVLVEMNATNYDTEQLQASCIICYKSDFSIKFIKEWVKWCTKPNMIDDSPSVLPNLNNFREHRHDQAILTNLAIKHGLTFHWWAAQYSLRHRNQYNNNYGVTFQHHRKRNDEY